ncbi:MAG: helix-turn-helix domain-containing protein [Clostridia bacterium]
MTFGDRLSALRKEHHYTQEQLAEILGVSRQAVGKWESGRAYPETEKLIRISELFDCSLDELLKDGEKEERIDIPKEARFAFPNRIRERKSERILWGMPLWHIGRNARGVVALGLNARGIVAVGMKARGVVSLGLFSFGVISLGLLSLGLLAFGLLVLGVFAAGSISGGILACGAVSFGIVSLGAVAVGDFAAGALAVGKYFALGDHATAMVALGDSHATGSVYQQIGEVSAGSVAAVRTYLDAVVPSWLNWAKEIVLLFL